MNKTTTVKLEKVRAEIRQTISLTKDLQAKARTLDQKCQNLLNHYRDLDKKLQRYEQKLNPAETPSFSED